MNEKELRKLISEGLKSGMVNEVEIDGIEEVPMYDVDMPIQDKAIFSAMDGDEPIDDFSDLIAKYRKDGGDYEGGYEDDASVSPGYFNEGETVQITKEQLQDIIKEGVEKLHRKTLIENRIEQINQELNQLSNPEAWAEARNKAQAELEKKTISWRQITERPNALINECAPPKYDEYGVANYLAGAPLLPENIREEAVANLKQQQAESAAKRELGIVPGSEEDKNFKL